VYRTFWGVNTDIEKKDFLMGRDLGFMEASVLYMLINMYIKTEYGNINWQEYYRNITA
jgi:hypothetical protein